LPKLLPKLLKGLDKARQTASFSLREGSERMRAAIFGAAAIAVLAAPSAALAQGAYGLFISPMGEPYRVEENSEAAPITLWMTAADTNADGLMSQEEFLSNAMRFFTRLDRNQDNIATSLDASAIWYREAPEMFSEWDPATPTREAEIRARRDSIDGPVEDGRRRTNTGPRRRGAQAYGLLDDVEPVMSCDRSFDRRITRAEWQECAVRRFGLIDKNADGSFALDEVGRD
jgi:hypothetical protein